MELSVQLNVELDRPETKLVKKMPFVDLSTPQVWPVDPVQFTVTEVGPTDEKKMEEKVGLRQARADAGAKKASPSTNAMARPWSASFE